MTEAIVCRPTCTSTQAEHVGTQGIRNSPFSFVRAVRSAASGGGSRGFSVIQLRIRNPHSAAVSQGTTTGKHREGR